MYVMFTPNEGQECVTVGQIPLREYPTESSKNLHTLLRGVDVIASGIVHGPWAKVDFSDGNVVKSGWVMLDYLEPMRRRLDLERDVVDISTQTTFKYDAKQNAFWKGKIQYNLCGELCVCYLSGTPLSSFLELWEVKAPSFFNRIFKGGLSTVTGIGDLTSMLQTVGMGDKFQTLYDALSTITLERLTITPYRFEKILAEGYKPIAAVKIQKSDGYLMPSGIGHWVVVDSVVQSGPDTGDVLLYNPYNNAKEEYSWREFKSSLGNATGIIVKA